MESMNPYQSPTADVSARPTQGGFDDSSPFSPKGRFGRLSYLAWGMLLAIPVWIIAAIIGVSAAMVGGDEAAAFGSPLILLVELIILVPMIIFAIRRLHDYDASGWWAVLLVVPVANLFLALMLLLRPGTEGTNRFAPPRITRGWEKVLGYIGIVFMILAMIGIIAAIAIPTMMATR